IVRGPAEDGVERLGAVRGELDRVTLLLEPLPDEARDLSLVLDDQDPHGCARVGTAGGPPAASELRGGGGFAARVVSSPANPPPPRSASPVAQRACGLRAHLLH